MLGKRGLYFKTRQVPPSCNWSSSQSNVAPQMISLYLYQHLSISFANPFLSFSQFPLVSFSWASWKCGLCFLTMTPLVHHNLSSVSTSTLELLWQTWPAAFRRPFPRAVLVFILLHFSAASSRADHSLLRFYFFNSPGMLSYPFLALSFIIFSMISLLLQPLNRVVSPGYHLVSYCM